MPSAVSLEESPIVTSAVGSLSRTTANWTVPPSLVTRDNGSTVTPAVSSSVLVTETSSGSIAVYLPSLPLTGPTIIV